jgi:tryptophan synthase beta chain
VKTDLKGFFGEYGGQFVPETLIPALDILEESFFKFKKDRNFNNKLSVLLNTYAGRPTPVYKAENLSKIFGFNLYLKREDLLHTGAHKINNTLGQGLLAKAMGKTRVIAETGAGQHGVATATAAALLNLECTVYMGAVDMERQKPNVERMKMLGAKVVKVENGSKTLKDATNAALQDYVTNVVNTHYIIGSVVGPYPFPEIVAYFQQVIGQEAKAFFEKEKIKLDIVVAPVGGGSNAIGIFKAFLDNPKIKLIGVEAGGFGEKEGEHARTIGLGRDGILHGCLTKLLQNNNHQVMEVHSISAGLDYPGVGPEHAFLEKTGKVEYCFATDKQTVNAALLIAKKEGIIAALESSHALAYVMENKEKFQGKTVLVNLSGRGDKDMQTIARYL